MIEKKKNDLIQGLKAEDLFIQIVEKHGYYILKSSTKQDMLEHWDVRLIKDPLDLYLDIKKEKDATIKYDYTWLEKKNVHGKTGWLYATKLSGIAFQRKGYFHIIPIEPLRKLYEEKVVDKFELHFNKPDNLTNFLYKQYSRVNWGRSDVSILVPFSDILPYTMLKFKIE